MPEFKVGDWVRYSKSLWQITDREPGSSLCIIEDSWDIKVVPISSLKKASKK